MVTIYILQASLMQRYYTLHTVLTLLPQPTHLHRHSDTCIQLTQFPDGKEGDRTARWKSRRQQYGLTVFSVALKAAAKLLQICGGKPVSGW